MTNLTLRVSALLVSYITEQYIDLRVIRKSRHNIEMGRSIVAAKFCVTNIYPTPAPAPDNHLLPKRSQIDRLSGGVPTASVSVAGLFCSSFNLNCSI
jgi:hypothetical protein